MLSSYFIHILIIVGIGIILAVSLNVAVGYAGLMNLGHIAFYGIGAYASAILTMKGVPFPLALLAAAAIAGCAGLAVMLIVNKLKGDYLVLATLGFSLVVFAVFLNWTSLTRGPLGIPGIPKPSFLGWQIASPFQYLVFTAIVTALAILFFYRLTHSRYGMLLQGVRDEPLGLMSLGKNVWRLKAQTLAASAAWAGVAGSLLAHYISFIDPWTFYLNDIIAVFTIVIVGGIASLRGTVVAAGIITILPELLRFLALPSSVVGPLRQIIYAVVLLAILLFRPRGLFGKIDLH